MAPLPSPPVPSSPVPWTQEPATFKDRNRQYSPLCSLKHDTIEPVEEVRRLLAEAVAVCINDTRIEGPAFLALKEAFGTTLEVGRLTRFKCRAQYPWVMLLDADGRGASLNFCQEHGPRRAAIGEAVLFVAQPDFVHQWLTVEKRR